MKKALLVMIGLVLLAGAGLGGFIWFGGMGDEDGPLSADSLSGIFGSGEESAAPPVFVDFDPIVLPVIGPAGVEQIISIIVALEVRDQAAADRVRSLQPRLNDAFLRSLYGTLYTEDIMPHGVIDLTVIKRRLVEECNRVIGPGYVRDALVQMVGQRVL